MPTAVTVDFSQLRQRIALQRQALSDTAIQARAYVEVLRARIHSEVSAQASGNMEKALCTIVGPWQTATGWAIGVGDLARVGLPSEAPKSRITIRQFLDWFTKQLEAGEIGAVQAYYERSLTKRERGVAVTIEEAQVMMQATAEARRKLFETAAVDAGARIREVQQPSGQALTVEAARAKAARLQQEIQQARAQRDREVAGVTDPAARATLRQYWMDLIEHKRYDLTRHIAWLRRMRGLAK